MVLYELQQCRKRRRRVLYVDPPEIIILDIDRIGAGIIRLGVELGREKLFVNSGERFRKQQKSHHVLRRTHVRSRGIGRTGNGSYGCYGSRRYRGGEHGAAW